MTVYENECCGCPPEMGCLGNACPKRNVLQRVCDICGEYADYIAEGTDYCEEHFDEYLDSALEDMGIGTEGMDDIDAKAEFLGVHVECIA